MTSPPAAIPAVLRLQDVCKNFGALKVSQNINLSLQAGARHALIGPNGAGKTTLINLITGVLVPSSGHVSFLQEDITSLQQAQRVRKGLVRTFQINQLFRGMTVLENVCLSVAEKMGVGHRLFKALGKQSEVIDESMRLLEQFKLAGDANNRVQDLAYGRQRLIEIVIALGQQPKVLLLDEPAAGVPEAESRLILDAVDRLDEKIAVLIIEHDMDIVFRFAKQISVLVSGEILFEGAPDEVANSERVKNVYLGGVAH